LKNIFVVNLFSNPFIYINTEYIDKYKNYFCQYAQESFI
jgi:hypothetical protein